MKNLKQVMETIKKNDEQGAFNDADQLIDFINDYNMDDRELSDIEDYIAEYADGLVPIYYYDIVKEWQDNADCHEMTLEVCGEYNQKEGIYKMMMSDLYFFYEQQLREDYEKLIELMEEEEEEEEEGNAKE